MSSGEGADETSKDAADIAAFFKSGKPENGSGRAKEPSRKGDMGVGGYCSRLSTVFSVQWWGGGGFN